MRSHLSALLVFSLMALLAACSRPDPTGPGGVGPSALSQVPAVRLNYRYEADVPPPDAQKDAVREDRNQAVQADFDANRSHEMLDRTLTSPDGKRIVAVYTRLGDKPLEFRLDMYTADGRPLKKITSDAMAVHFPDIIRWSPDSSTVAFVAMVRGVTLDETATSAAPDPEISIAEPPANTDANTTDVSPDANASVDANAAAPVATPAAPIGILTFRTEQIYICNADGDATKAITQNEGLIYFYHAWSPDSTMLAALAAKSIEWRYLESRADAAGELFIPVGRLRVIETNGRERRLADELTAVQPVWSPDSAKVAAAFGDHIRIYDALGNNPTQAAIPLRNHLLLSSQVYDREQAAKLNASGEPDANANAAPEANANSAAPATLPDPATLVSFNPIVALNWTADDLLYFQTAYIKRMKNEADNVTSFPRWHRLVLTPQAVTR